MVAIKDMEMPKNCVECNHMDLQQAINCQLIGNLSFSVVEQ